MLFSLPGKYHNMLHFNKAAHIKHTFYSLFSDLLSEDTVASALCVQRCSNGRTSVVRMYSTDYLCVCVVWFLTWNGALKICRSNRPHQFREHYSRTRETRV